MTTPTLRPQAKMFFAVVLILALLALFIHSAEHRWFGLKPAPEPTNTQPARTMGTTLWTTQVSGVERDGDWNIAMHYAGFSNGEDALLAPRQSDDTSGFPALDNALRYVWNNAGMLMLIFGLLAGISILHSRAGGETHNEQMRREAEELEQPGLSEDIHEPFDAPEGMQPASQYVSVRTRQ